MSEAVLVAIIAAFGVIVAGLPAALIERARRENSTDHAEVRHRLERIDDHLDEIENAVDDVAETLVAHINDKEAHGVDTQGTESD
jgi:predicted lipid-binding transport protein (Tim44 family)